jgi:general L-amino acid transport system permease protein
VRDPRLRGIALQVAFVALIAAIIGFLAYNTTVNLRRQNIATGFGFLTARPRSASARR